MNSKTTQEIEYEISVLKNRIEQVSYDNLIEKIKTQQELTRMSVDMELKRLQYNNEIFKYQTDMQNIYLQHTIQSELKQLCNDNYKAYNLCKSEIDKMITWVRQNSPITMTSLNVPIINDINQYQVNLVAEPNYNANQPSALEKIISCIVKYIISSIENYTDISAEDRQALGLCHDILGAYHLGQTLNNKNDTPFDKFQALLETIRLFNKYCWNFVS